MPGANFALLKKPYTLEQLAGFIRSRLDERAGNSGFSPLLIDLLHEWCKGPSNIWQVMADQWPVGVPDGHGGPVCQSEVT